MMEINYQSSYVEATQDGIVRLIYNKAASNEIMGLYTDGLESCIALLIVGNQGISLIHNLGRINAATLKRECELVGDIKYWTIAFNPNADDEYKSKLPDAYKCKYPKGIFQSKMEYLLKCGIEVKKYQYYPDLNQYNPANKGFVAIDKDGNINVDMKPSSIKEPLNKQKRHWINSLNAYFLRDNEFAPGDLQFDGENFTVCSDLLKSLEEMYQIAKLEMDQNGFDQIASYTKLYAPEKLHEMEAEERLNMIADIQWKKYPAEKLTGKYIGHQVRFFTMGANASGQQAALFEDLKRAGFDITKTNVKEKTSLIVDLTTSRLNIW